MLYLHTRHLPKDAVDRGQEGTQEVSSGLPKNRAGSTNAMEVWCWMMNMKGGEWRRCEDNSVSYGRWSG